MCCLCFRTIMRSMYSSRLCYWSEMRELCCFMSTLRLPNQPLAINIPRKWFVFVIFLPLWWDSTWGLGHSLHGLMTMTMTTTTAHACHTHYPDELNTHTYIHTRTERAHSLFWKKLCAPLISRSKSHSHSFWQRFRQRTDTDGSNGFLS